MIKATTVIILVNYNGYRDTKECIQSIKASEAKLPFIVLVDNNSSNSKKLNYLKKIYSKLHIIYNEKNEGFGVANNIGIKWAQEYLDFEYLLLLNNDTLLGPNAVKELITPFGLDESIGLTTGKIFYEGNRDIIWYGGGNLDTNNIWPKIDDFNNIQSTKGAQTSKYVTFISGCLMMFNKSSINLLKGFDNKFFMYCEDLEISLRALKLGLKMYYTTESVIYHKVQGSLKNDTFKSIVPKNPNLKFLFLNMKKNQYICILMHCSGLQIIIVLFNYHLSILLKLFKYLFYLRFDMVGTILSLFWLNIKFTIKHLRNKNEKQN